MSELKVYHCNEWHNEYTEFYMKSEADKVIAELKNACNDKDNWCLHTLKEFRHQKYKRCLAMAWWCSAELGMLVSTWESKIKYYKRWQKRWRGLAEKFKEAK